MKKLALHWQILIGMTLGILWGMFASGFGLVNFTLDWVKPFGTIFINLLKLIAVPLVLVSLVTGVSSLSDISRLSRIGSRTIGIYLTTTVLAVILGLLLVNVFEPGKAFSAEKREEFKEQFAGATTEKSSDAESVKKQGPLQPLVDIVPSNIFHSMTDNGSMLQVIFFALLFGIALIMIPPDKAQPVNDFFEGLNMAILKVVDIIMKTAPYGVFALLAGLVVEFAGDDPGSAVELLLVLGYYCIVVTIGLALMIFIVYPLLVVFVGKTNYKTFLKGIFPAQMLAFSTSSSAATLPVTMECAEKNLGINREVSSFVLPLGATINMDGTSLYQSVAAVFIAQAYGMDLDLMTQLGIVMTATLASIGAAAVPGAGTVMLVIVLQQAGIPVEGIALILAPDRILDMLRTTVNVTGDATVAMMIARTEGQLHPVKETEEV
ncbi:dicarboxylate/amino acid:cation symporter [Pontibacter sp. BT310]|jgi:Na+/H+-dicarboxylate symporter|uniref:Dicarboxylate/amino acid:cation symporter n=1 Tax=Pontibacter populi TaxID=890055 RepID=A0ABS6XCD1_9BACT|nr:MULTISPECIES: dicarboxylate/amino acid:cation symporter [Pontibacter]MBJ6118801.1 dicarboxylate/amino acid:cation symporter [Pontibacter sp. BT310]MBR0571229.1 dicarboxylate/amino acid:cation symporter [Microvirga sp. STS03]MBW3365655.1 dicarboxylate/amino acid:cation symporter [Pontibacter populi]